VSAPIGGHDARRATEAGRAIGAAGFMSGEILVLREQVTLSLDTLATVWRRENLGDLHNVLVDVAYWRDDDGEKEALRLASGELAAKGLLAGRDLAPDFRNTLLLVARPAVEFYGWIATRDSESEAKLGVLLAAVDQDAVLVIRDGDQVSLQNARAEGLAETLVGQLPQVEPARGRSINLPEHELRTLLGSRVGTAPGAAKPLPADAYDVFGRASMAEDAQELFTAMDLPRTGGGELYVATRDRNGERHRCASPLVYVDTQSGRWMTQVSGNQPGDRWVVSTPASRQLLISRLHEMRNALVGSGSPTG
jgi:hypothetical protein